MYPPTFPQTANNTSTPFPIGSNGTAAQLPGLQGNPAFYSGSQNPYAQNLYAQNPYSQGGVAPQGFLGSVLGSVAGRLLGGLAGQGDIGRTLGGAAGGLLFPLQAGAQGQQQPQFDPQGFWSALKNVVSVATKVASVLPLQAGPQFQSPYQQLSPQQAQLGPQSFWSNYPSPTVRYPSIPNSASSYPGGILPFQAGPSSQQADFDPQGFWSSLKKVVSHIPDVVNVAQSVAGVLPLQAGPQPQPYNQQLAQFDPQGFWSSLKKVVSSVPDVVNAAQSIAQVLPFQAGPQLAPQGFGGDLIGQLAQTTGAHLGGPWGQAVQGVGPLLQHLIPFQAGPQAQQQGLQQQFDPQGFWSALKKVVSAVPDAVNAAQSIAQVLPFQAGPQLAPQGFGGDLIGQLAQTTGAQLGGPWGQAVQGIAPLLQQLIPFQAGPQAQQQQYLQQQFDPQGFWSALKKVVSHVPDVVGAAQSIAQVLPFQAGPQLSPQVSLPDLLRRIPNLQQILSSLPAQPAHVPFSPFQPIGQA